MTAVAPLQTQTLATARRLVVKIGSATLTTSESSIDYGFLNDLADQVARVRAAGWDVVIVTSAAIACGLEALGIAKRPFTAEDSISVAGYMAYSFAAAFRTEPVLTQVRDQLGADYLKVFDLDWHPGGAVAQRLGRDD